MRKLLATASVLALLAAPAVAQDNTPPPSTQAPAEKIEPPATPSVKPAPSTDKSADMKTMEKSSVSSVDQWRASKLLGQKITNSASESVGDINDLLIDKSGKVTAVVVGVGGFLGMGEKNVALDFGQLQFSRDTNNNLIVMANATKDSLQSAPEWKDPTKVSKY